MQHPEHVTKVRSIFTLKLEMDTNKEAGEAHFSGLCGGKKVICEELKTRYPAYKSCQVAFTIQFSNSVINSEQWLEVKLVNDFMPKRMVNG